MYWTGKSGETLRVRHYHRFKTVVYQYISALPDIISIIGLNFSLAQVYITAYHGGMRILPISKIKDKLNEYVDAVALTEDQITITKNGAPAAVLVGADEWESLQETLYWLSQPKIMESIAEADADIAAGRTYGEDEIRAEFGVPRRPS
jgi:antitoxin YefM